MELKQMKINAMVQLSIEDLPQQAELDVLIKPLINI